MAPRQSAWIAVVCLLASAPAAPSGAEPLGGDGHVLELAAVPPSATMLDRVHLVVEPEPAGAGSGAAIGPAAEAGPPVTDPPDATLATDPWAEAFAASAGDPAPSPAPSYPVVLNREVQAFVDRFTGLRREVIDRWWSRSAPYLIMIRDILRRQGLPEDLVFVAMIESGFDPLAVSRAGAKGLWQFMAGTARRYGLRVDRWVDERLDPERSTIAAAAYFRDLFAMFGSWPLAQAAYNAGEVRVARAMRLAGTTDFWALAHTNLLRPETRLFVPQVHAMTLIGRDPARFDFAPPVASPPAVEVIQVPAATDLGRLARLTGIAPGALRALNPALARGVTPPGAAWDLKVPAGSRDGVLTALAPPTRPVAKAGGRMPAPAAEIHVVRLRDTVTSIARRYGVSVDDVLRWNSLHRQDRIRPGDRLRVAAAGAPATRR